MIWLANLYISFLSLIYNIKDIFWVYNYNLLYLYKGFSSGSYSLSIIPHSAELASEKENNYNNVIFETESSWSRSHVMTTIIQFDFYYNVSSSLAPIWSLKFLLGLCTQFSLTLHIWPLTVYATELAGYLCKTQKDLPLWYLSADYPLVEIWGWIIFGRHLVVKRDRIAWCSQTSFFV